MPLKLSLMVCLVAFMICSKGQSFIGQREVVNFTKQAYNAGRQNWKILQDKQGRCYFANNEGVLIFDGSFWKLYPLPNKTIVWSFDFGNDNKLYVGGQDEIGYFGTNKYGNLSYTSLKELLDTEDQKFADVWNIVHLGNDVFFRTTSKIFRYHDGKITVLLPWSAWGYMGIYNNQLIAHDEEKGIMVLHNNQWQTLVPGSALPAGFYITGMAPYDNGSLITTAKNGLFVLNDKGINSFQAQGTSAMQGFTSVIQLNNGSYLLGTYNNGIIHIQANGALIEAFTKAEGLQNNNIKSLLADQFHNIWVGLENGISFIPFNSAIKHINPPVFNDASGFAMALHEQQLFFGLSNGIYSLPITNTLDLSFTLNNVHRIAEGQTWQLYHYKNLLLAGKEEGFFQYNNSSFTPIDVSTGYWTFKPYDAKNDSFALAAGNYLGLHLFSYQNNHFINKGIIPNLNTSARYVEYDSALHCIWVSHPYRGVYKINLQNNNVQLYTAANGLPSTLNNHVFKIKNEILIATEKGIYTYNATTDNFQSSASYQPIFDSLSIRYLKDDAAGNIWFVHEKTIGVVDFSTSKPFIVYLPELSGKILSGFEHVFPIDQKNIFISGESGFYHLNYLQYKQNIHPLTVYIRNVNAKNKEANMVFGGFYGEPNADASQSAENFPSITHKYNSVQFQYSVAFDEQQSSIEYRYWLKGFDKEWSEWTKKSEKEYTNLPAGFYTFQIQARNNLNNTSAISSYSFYILPPWYKSIWAYLVYGILLIVMIMFLYKFQENKIQQKQEKRMLEERKKYEEEQRNLEYQHQLALEKAEKELIQLKNEKLESEINFKNAELASTAMNLVQKKEFLLKIKDELSKINKSGKEQIELNELKKILKELSEEKNLNDEWEQFSVHFNQVHSNFLLKLKSLYPDLTANELKLCAYLRMNLSSKEIAQLMSISTRGVEIGRYRLRKKLQIPSDANLFRFLLDIEESNTDGVSSINEKND
ncbi:MAG: ligand-binding sensor domain-containing protein [Hydrotalea sp.]